MPKHLLAFFMLAAGLGGCMTVGPDYQKPKVDVPAAWPGASTEAPVSVRWWTLYNDPHLDLLIDEALAHNTDLRVAAARVDEALALLTVTRADQLPNVKGFYYMRLHGRNAAAWWRHEKSEDRYDYLYSAGELKELAETADAARHLVKKTYLYTNNHFSAKSVANAAMLKQQLGEPIPGEYPPEFAARYPEIASALTVSPLAASSPAGTGTAAGSDRLFETAPARRRSKK